MFLLTVSHVGGAGPFVEEHQTSRQVGRHHEGQGAHEQHPPRYPGHHDGGQAVAEHVLSSHQDGREVLIQGDLGHLEDGDGVVADHVGATEGLSEEEEDEESHGEEDGPVTQPGEGLSPGPGLVTALRLDHSLQGGQLLLHLLHLQTPQLAEVLRGLLPPAPGQEPGGGLGEEDEEEGREEGEEGPGDAGESPGEEPAQDVHQEVPGVGRRWHEDGEGPPEVRGGDLPEVDGGNGDTGPDAEAGDGPGDVEVVERGRLPGKDPADNEREAVQEDGHTATEPEG